MRRKLINSISKLAIDAGNEILRIYKSTDFEIKTKSDGSLLTEADQAAHQIIIEGLSKLDVNLPVLSEESTSISTEERALWKRYWLVDPLDGTAEFVEGNGEFTVNIALIENHEPRLGVVHAPDLGLTYLGGKNLGAMRRDDEGERVIKCRTMDSVIASQELIVIMESRRHAEGGANSLLTKIQSKIGAYETRNMGSSLKICYIAEGKADLYPRLGPTSEWDTAAAHAILDAAGGSIIDPDFKPLSYNSKEDLLNPFFFAIGDANYDWSSVIKDQSGSPSG